MFGRGDSAVARWLREPFDLDGWRIDVANMTGRFGQHDHADTVAREILATMDAVKPGSALLAEHCHDASDDLLGDGWQGTMNYAGFTRPVWSWLTSADNGLTFLGMPVGVPRRSGRATAITMRDFAASVPWKVANRHWNLLSSHDTPRIRTAIGDPEFVRLGVAVQKTYLGAPMIFSGDELGFQGRDGEDSRRPIQWDKRTQWDIETFSTFRDLIAIRKAHRALRRGGLRWVIATDDALGYLRETADERILVVVAQSPWSGALLPASLLRGHQTKTVYGENDLAVTGRALVIPGTGPGVGIWRLS